MDSWIDETWLFTIRGNLIKDADDKNMYWVMEDNPCMQTWHAWRLCMER